MAVGKRLENKVAMITGGASGIGAESARLFAEHGAAVAIADINDNLGPKVVGEIESAGGSALYVHLDTALEEEWREAMAAVAERFGRLDIMLNAAGVSGRLPDGSAAPRVGDANLENWNHVMAVNATGVFLGTKYAIEPMREAGGGSIINISSIYGIVGSPYSTAYHAAKGAIRTFTKTAAIQCAADNIRVNSIHPGFCRTPLTDDGYNNEVGRYQWCLDRTPIGRLGNADDVAYGMLYLASDESRYVTGAELVIDGGMTAQ